MERLDTFQRGPLGPDQQDDIENDQWLDLLRPFITVKVLYLSEEIIPSFTSALQELVGDRVIEVLPVLQGLFLEEFHPSGSVKEVLDKFTDARQFSGRPIAISHCNEFDILGSTRLISALYLFLAGMFGGVRVLCQSPILYYDTHHSHINTSINPGPQVHDSYALYDMVSSLYTLYSNCHSMQRYDVPLMARGYSFVR